MLKFVIQQPGSATITLRQVGAERPLVFGTSVVADWVDLHKYPDAQSWCPVHRILEGVNAPVIPDSHVEFYDEASIANALVVPFDLWLTGHRRQILRYNLGWGLPSHIDEGNLKRQVCLGLVDLIAYDNLMHANSMVRGTQLPEGCTVVYTNRTVPHYILDTLRELHNNASVYTCYYTPHTSAQQYPFSVITDEELNAIRYSEGHLVNGTVRTPCTQPQHMAGIVEQALSLQDSILNKPLNANGAYNLSMFQPGLEWYDLAVDDGHLTDSFREEFAVEAGCNEKVLKWARVPVTDENVFALYPPMAVFEFAASMLCA